MSNDERKVKAGDVAPDFKLKDQNDRPLHFADFRGKWIVVYFYPRDYTAGCSLEAHDFTKHINDFAKLDAFIFGISADSTHSHKGFAQKGKFKITLLSDRDKATIRDYGAYKVVDKNDKEHIRIVRSTFLIDPEGKIAHVWRRVKVHGHVDEVLKTLKELQKG